MNVFIDTNVLLDFFRMSSGDLEEIRKIAGLARAGGLTFLFTDIVQDEFDRNREGVIAQSLSQFNKSTLELHRPNIVRAHPESLELEHLQAKFRELKRVISERVRTEAAERRARADEVIGELFEAAAAHTVDDDVIQRALSRVKLGRPPGKNESVGDAIHWEWLLQHVQEGEDLHLISRDGDFESDLQEGHLAAYLEKEWSGALASSCYLYRSLDEFLRQHFGEVRLADQAHKYVAIEKLETSPNFATTHNAIATLATIDDYTPDELIRLVTAYLSNPQIHWILGDRDVGEFAYKLVTMAYEIDLISEVYPLEEMLGELELEEEAP